MKRILLMFCAVLICVNAKAQCPLKEAVDFTSIDHNDNEINLFEILDGGQYVLINFFCTTSVQCQSIEPNIVEAHRTLGRNDLDVFFIGVSPTDNINSIDKWVDTYGIEYPIIYSASEGTHGGDEIYNTYQIPFYPMLILIAPNREIVIQDLWPITSAQSIVDALVEFDIEVPEVPEYTDYRNVLIEEFTGRNCGYCPDGHVVANQLAASRPGRVFPINIHAGGFSPTNYPNLNTEDGNTILYGFDVPGYPTGNVNRISGTAYDREVWFSKSYSQLEQLAEVLIDGKVEIDRDNRKAEIIVDLLYMFDSQSATNYLTVMMIQDSIWGSQSNGSLNPEQYLNGEYCHMHVLRDVVTPTWGDEIPITMSGSEVTKTYIYEIPQIIGSPNGVEVDIDNIYFLAIVTEKYQGVATRPVLNVNKLQCVINEGESGGDENEDFLPPVNVVATASGTSSISLTWSAAENALSYNVYQDDKLVANVNATYYNVKDLDYNTEYCYTVTSLRYEIESECSERVCVKTLGEGIEEYRNNIDIYPNPIENHLFVDAEESVKEILIYNVMGNVVFKETTFETEFIDVSSLVSGVYYIKIETKDAEVIRRFVKI